MAMKHSLHYPDCEDFLNALSGECTAKGNWLGWIKESQTDCWIFRGSLIHRTQMAWITATGNQTPFGLTLEQCAHTRVCDMNRVMYTRSCELSRDDDDDDAESQSVLWLDLGSETLDEKWQRYFQRGRFECKYQQQPDGLFLSSVFENDGGFRSKIEDQRYASLVHSSVPEEPAIDKH
ncbi:hypothetical protein BOTCAL_0277g00060 [Botryotinia calthae]|uniref:Uncharacterized protein n=1 Tax=Botryotinia calthae TaxID=38488 RepID=A0A4Y8CW15_9HELO|nr:hypothetical protein BOTCAL_0277g00060 [Botryotinia calthae]